MKKRLLGSLICICMAMLLAFSLPFSSFASEHDELKVAEDSSGAALEASFSGTEDSGAVSARAADVAMSGEGRSESQAESNKMDGWNFVEFNSHDVTVNIAIILVGVSAIGFVVAILSKLSEFFGG